MTEYDPQKGGPRPRPVATDPSPLDALLGDPTPGDAEAAPTMVTADTPPTDEVVDAREKPHLRVAPVPAEDPAIVEYKNYGLAALIVLVILFLIRKKG